MRGFLIGMGIVCWMALGAGGGEAPAPGVDWADVLPGELDGYPASEMMTRYLRNQVYQALDRREAAWEQIKTLEQIAGYQKTMRQFFVEQLGGFWEKTPLNAQTTGSRNFADYRLEKLIYQSQPGLYVTAVLYLPKSAPPFPGVLFPCGHSDNGKASDVYQRACVLLAKHGFAVLCYDPFDQGERYQILDGQGKPQFGGTLGHTLVGIGSILLGRNAATYRIWDGIRGIDYLTSRPDIDPARIGCTGNSGGGTLTSYLMALDERIACAVPSCYLTTLRNQEPQDAEQNIHAQAAFGMDHADYLLMRAPKPTLMSTATRDFFDIHGAWFTFRQAKRMYTRMGFAERVELIETDAEHGFSVQLREGMVRWMKRWLMKVEDPLTEPEITVLPDAELQCTPQGQVGRLAGAKTIYELNRQIEAQLQNERKQFWRTAPRAEALKQVRTLAGIRPLDQIPQLGVDKMESVSREGYDLKKLALKVEEGLWIPAVVLVPAASPGEDFYLILDGGGKESVLRPEGLAVNLVRQGNRVMAADLPGLGETAGPAGANDWSTYIGPCWQDVYLAYCLGKSYVGMRAENTLALARFLTELQPDGVPRRIHLIATGEAGPAALHAAALEPDLFETVKIRQSLGSWSNVIQNTVTKNQLVNTVHGALRKYDLPDLAATLPADQLTIEEPVDALGNPVK
ncbi:MAG: acetylxylan esterase [bacterium]